MKRLAIAGFFLLVLAIAAPAFGIRTGPLPGDRIGILETPQRASPGVDGAVRRAMPRYLQSELRRAGFSAELLRLTIDEVAQERAAVDFYIEIAWGNADGGAFAAIGTGGIIGTGVGAEVAIVAASVEAEVRIYDARSLDLVDSFTLRSDNVSPAITGISLGDRHGYFAFEIPYLRNEPFRRATRDIAHQAVARISGMAGEGGR